MLLSCGWILMQIRVTHAEKTAAVGKHCVIYSLDKPSIKLFFPHRNAFTHHGEKEAGSEGV